jgi:hypothetical protein
MRPKGSADVLEARRWRALALLKRRLSLNEIARTFGCAASSVMIPRSSERSSRTSPSRTRGRVPAPPLPLPAPPRPDWIGSRARRTLWQRLLERPASEYGTLCHGDGAQGRYC